MSKRTIEQVIGAEVEKPKVRETIAVQVSTSLRNHQFLTLLTR